MDTSSLTAAQHLQVQAAQLFSLTTERQTHVSTQVGALDLLIYDAKAREHRRAEFNLRDRAAYRLGGAFEPVGGLGLDHVALTGWLALGVTGLLLLNAIAQRKPDGTIPEFLAELFASEAGDTIRDHGAWVRWTWLRELYLEETTRFLLSKKGQDPKARWRDEKPTVNQTYLVAQICLDLQLENRSFARRGAAFDWIKAQGGNPRFSHDRPPVDLSGLLESIQ